MIKIQNLIISYPILSYPLRKAYKFQIDFAKTKMSQYIYINFIFFLQNKTLIMTLNYV